MIGLFVAIFLLFSSLLLKLFMEITNFNFEKSHNFRLMYKCLQNCSVVLFVNLF